MPSGVEHESVVVAPPTLADLATFEDDMIDPALDQLARNCEAGGTRADDDDGWLTPRGP